MDKKNVSMNDVAVAAGVSLKTVSRVINEPDSVRESTRDKVHSAMEALGFRTNFAARSLKLGRYGCIGVVLFVIVIVNDFVRWRRGKKALLQA